MIEKIAFLLVLIGALNWGVVGLVGIDLVQALLGDMTIYSRAVYILVGLSAIICAIVSVKKSMDKTSCTM